MSGGFDVGSIVGHLVLDKNQWTQAVNSVRQDQAALKKSFSSLSEDLRDVGRGLAVAGAAITGTFTMLIKGAVDAGDEINDLSKKTGISTELLSGYKLAADKSGTSLQGFAIGMKGLANQMQAAHDQGGAAKKTLDSLGVSYQDNTGKLRPLDQVLLDVADRFTKMPDGATKSALAVDVFGKAGADLIPLLNLGRRGLEENYAAAEKLGLVYSKDAAEGADEFNDSLAELKGSVQGLGNQITQALMPTLKPIVSDLKDVIVSVREWAKNNPELAASLAKTALGAGTLAGGIGAVCIVLPSFLSGWSKLWPLIQAAGPYIVAAGAAWAGWKFGEQLGEITGLNQAIQDEISSGKGLVAMYLKWTGQLREVNVEFGERHAAAAATREAAIKRASVISGQAVTTIQG
ncbi:MAG: phage tail tape measure protein, partial [Acidobacteriota bacterium]